MEDTLTIKENPDGSFEIEWDKQDPKWSWLNGLTNEEIQGMLEQAIKEELKSDD